MTRHNKIEKMSMLRTQISEMLKEYNKTSEEINFGSRLALLEGSFEVEFGEDEEEDEAWNSSPSC